MSGLLPYLTVSNAKTALNFYQEAFGVQVIDPPAMDDKSIIQHVEMRFGDEVFIMFACEGAWEFTRKAPVSQGVGVPLTLYLYCEDVDALYQRATSKGATSVMAPNDGSWGDRFYTLLDLDGYEWSFATYIPDHKV